MSPTYKPALYFMASDKDHQDARQRQMYRQATVLNAAGISACLVYLGESSHCGNLPIMITVRSTVEFKRLYRTGYDIVVLPGNFGTKINDYPGFKVIISNNLYSSVIRIPSTPASPDPILSESVIGILTTSYHNWEHLRTAYPHKEIHVIHPEFPADLVFYRHWMLKKKQIVITSKSHAHGAVLFHMLRTRARQGLNCSDQFKWIFADRLPLESFVAALQESLLFVELNAEDEFSERILAAIAAGCVCVTYDCAPHSEYCQAASLEYGQLNAVVRHIEKLMAAYPTNWGEYEEAARTQRMALRFYSPERHEASILHAWGKLIDHARNLYCSIPPALQPYLH